MGIFLFIYIKIYRIPLFRHLYLPYKSCILKYLHFLANYLFKRDHINPINKGFIHLNMGKMKIMLKNKYKYKKINNQWVRVRYKTFTFNTNKWLKWRFKLKRIFKR